MFPDTEEVRSSNLLTPTINSQVRGYFIWPVFLVHKWSTRLVHKLRWLFGLGMSPRNRHIGPQTICCMTMGHKVISACRWEDRSKSTPRVERVWKRETCGHVTAGRGHRAALMVSARYTPCPPGVATV